MLPLILICACLLSIWLLERSSPLFRKKNNKVKLISPKMWNIERWILLEFQREEFKTVRALCSINKVCLQFMFSRVAKLDKLVREVSMNLYKKNSLQLYMLKLLGNNGLLYLCRRKHLGPILWIQCYLISNNPLAILHFVYWKSKNFLTVVCCAI